MDMKLIKLTVKNKLFLGFGAVILVSILMSLKTIFGMAHIRTIEDRLLHLRFPTVLAGAQLENGINKSLAGLRGYMILGKDPISAQSMKNVRLEGWKDIDDAMTQMHVFSKSWTNLENIEKLNQMSLYVDEFRKAQQEVESIAHTVDEVPAFKTLLTEAAPRATKILTSISAIIDEEANLEATPNRKKLLKLLADSRGSFAIGLANIRAYLLSGEDKFRDSFQAKWKINETRFKQISSMTNLMTTSQLQSWNNYKSIRTEFEKYPSIMFQQRSANNWNIANYWLGTKAAPKAKAIMQILTNMRNNQLELEETDTHLLEEETSFIRMAILIGTIVGIIISIGIALFISNLITVPLQRVVDRAKVITSGDLTLTPIETKGNDELTELTEAINSMNSNLHDIIIQIASSANELSSASSQLQSTASNTSQGMSNQQSQIDQVATAMNEMTSTVQEVARNATLAATSASEADGAAAQGISLVSENMQSITKLANGIEQASIAINKLGDDTNSVDSIVGVINDVAEQTNLLALNAAIEAARAGEQGRGFAVVADEVRTLAGRTQSSTEEIRAMMERLKSGAKNAVEAMETGHKQAQLSVEQAGKANNAINEITRAVASISEMNAHIATASEEQSAVAEEMNQNVVHISTESVTTLQNTQETSLAAEQVDSLASQLRKIVSHFKI